MISTRTDTGEPAALEAHRGVDRDRTAIYLDVYRRDQLLAIFVMTDHEAVAHIRTVANCLPAVERNMLASELAR